MNRTVRIIGIDPGLRQTGWGLIEAEGNALKFLSAGTIASDAKAPLATRLRQLYLQLEIIVADHNPQEAAIETTFVNRDANATLKLGHARGIAMLVPALAGVEVAEYAPNAVKKAVVGAGHGDKRQVQTMVRTLLPAARFDTEHAADALAVAICHASMRRSHAWAQQASDHQR